MTSKYSKGLAAVLVFGAAAMAMSGCGAQYKREIETLQGQNQSLQTDKSLLQSQLAQAQLAKGAAIMQLKSAQGRLLAADTRLKGMQSRTGGGAGIRMADGQTSLYYKELGSDLLFTSGSATLTGGGAKALNSVITELKSRHAGQIVRVYGHTDNDPIVKSRKLWQDNLDLSANRAMAVSRYLSSKGIKADLIETVAMGAARPVASNTTKAGKASNRRVEIVVVKK